jgi:CBS-domain-containing membrane protein
LETYFERWSGVSEEQGPFSPSLSYVLWSIVGAFVGICTLGAVQALCSDRQGLPGHYTIIASFGASCVLVFGVPQAPFAQPWNVVGGSTLSALVGVACNKYLTLGHTIMKQAIQSAVAVSLSTALMLSTGSTHPPGGASAMIATLAPGVGFGDVVFPVFTGSCVLVALGVVVNNVSGDTKRRYPLYWRFWENLGTAGFPVWAPWVAQARQRKHEAGDQLATAAGRVVH